MMVIDELFPLKSCKLETEDPIIIVIFSKNMNTLDYILGDPREKEVMRKAEEDRIKDERN